MNEPITSTITWHDIDGIPDDMTEALFMWANGTVRSVTRRKGDWYNSSSQDRLTTGAIGQDRSVLYYAEAIERPMSEDEKLMALYSKQNSQFLLNTLEHNQGEARDMARVVLLERLEEPDVIE